MSGVHVSGIWSNLHWHDYRTVLVKRIHLPISYRNHHYLVTCYEEYNK